MRVLNLDFETFSELNLLKVGAWAYSRHPSTRVICLRFCISEGPDRDNLVKGPRVGWRPADMVAPHPPGEMPSELMGQRFDRIVAYNSFFEWCIWHNVLNWPGAGGIDQWEDTAAAVAALSLPRAMGDTARAIGLDAKHLKDPRGKKLIQLLSKPDRKGNRNLDPELIEEMDLYCDQDVVSEMAIGESIFPLVPRERKIWVMDQRINLRGVHVDVEAVDIMLELIETETKKLNQRVAVATDGALKTVSSPKAVRAYLAEQCQLELPNYQSQTIKDTLNQPNLPDVARLILQTRQSTGKTSTAKVKALKAIVDLATNRAHGLLMYHGANTGRWSGKMFQPQNLPRPSFDDTDECIELIKDAYNNGRDTLAELALYYGDPMEAISSSVRGLIMAAPGHYLICSDYSSIEPRVLAWLCNNYQLLEVFRTGKDVYKFAAMGIFGVSYDEVTKEQRFIGKVATLALGYQGGKIAFMTMAESYGVEIDEDTAEEIKLKYRAANPMVVELWNACNMAAIMAVKNPGEMYRVFGKVVFRVVGGFLMCRLPSGRCLAYYRPRIGIGEKFGNEEVQFLGVDSRTRKFGLQSTYGGKLVENIVQAIARDIMADAMLKLEDQNVPVILTVHDEIICEVPNEKEITVEHFEAVMCDLEPWAADIPIKASDGYISQRYRK